MSSIADKVEWMTNKELNGLAQNRFIDKATQVALAKRNYKLCRQYLANNENLCKEARDILWGYRGYVLKSILVGAGHCVGEPAKYRELYQLIQKRKSFCQWRLNTAFIRNYWAHNDNRGPRNTPSDVLDSIVLSGKASHYALRDVTRHPNLSVKAICKLSTHSDSNIRNLAFNRLAQMKKSEEG